MTEDWRVGAVDYLQTRLPELRAVYLFGSRARGNESQLHPGSDYDFAFRQNPTARLSNLERFDLAVDLSIAIECGPLDLIDLTPPGEHELKLQVIDGDLLWTQDAQENLAWEIKATTMAFDFRISERPLREAKLATFRSYVQRDTPPQS